MVVNISTQRFMVLVMVYMIVICGIISESFSGWIDPDTPDEHQLTISLTDGDEFKLVMSDEFETPGRSFTDGHDPAWTALDKSDDDQTSTGRKSLHFYNSSNVYTEKGKLVIATNDLATTWKDFNPYKKRYEQMKRTFSSGMIQGWNKFCFTGGILEIDATFPGRSDVGGLWPALWILGNLGRATYEASTNKLWPWSYSQCNRHLQRAQEISACGITDHYSMHAGQGRGATEIDLVEVMPGKAGVLPLTKPAVSRPYGTSTLQIAPGIPTEAHRPPSGTRPEWGFHWYSNLSFGFNVSINPFFYGTYLGSTNSNEPAFRSKREAYQADAISSLRTIDETFFTQMHKWRLEWQPGTDGYVHFYVDGEYTFGVEASSLVETGAHIPNEPSYIIMNTAISSSWGFPDPPPGCVKYDCKSESGQCGMDPNFCSTLPAYMYIESVRVFQRYNDSGQTLGCNPEAYPTARFIKAHPTRYMRPYKDLHPLKDIIRGGGACTNDIQCGIPDANPNAQCVWRKCKCADDQTGPMCRTRTYSNNWVDWDTENMPPIQFPHVNSFLVAYIVCAFVTVIIAVTTVARGGIESKPQHWTWL
jgi:beta-glucan synthesis-associated protein KRE6